MEYRHISTGIIVNSDAELPASIYEKVEAAKPAAKEPEKKRKARGKTKEK